MSGFKLYTDAMSPVCRPVMLLLGVNNVPYELVKISLRSHENQTSEEVKEANPFTRKLPCINDNGFCLSESSAIMRYIVQKFKLPDHWYPGDLQARAKVEEALAWFPNYLRCGLFFHGVIAPIKTGQPRNEEKVKELTETVKIARDAIENLFLKDTKFIAGDEISIADLQFMGEVTQYWSCNYELEKEHPRMQQWLEECKKRLGATFEEVFQALFETRKSGRLNTKLDL